MQCLDLDYMDLTTCSYKYGIHPSTLRRYAANGVIACLKVGGHKKLFLRRIDVEGLLAIGTPADTEQN
jgi:hypothetical protein